MTPTLFAKDVINKLADQVEALTKERDALAANHKECVRCLGEALQDRADLAAAAKLALDALVAESRTTESNVTLAQILTSIRALRQSGVQ